MTASFPSLTTPSMPARKPELISLNNAILVFWSTALICEQIEIETNSMNSFVDTIRYEICKKKEWVPGTNRVQLTGDINMKLNK